MSKTSNPKIRKIERQQLENVTSGHIYIKLQFFNCVNCGSKSLRRTVSSRTYDPNDHTVKFDCLKCKHKSETVYSDRHNTDVDFEKYKEILKDEI